MMIIKEEILMNMVLKLKIFQDALNDFIEKQKVENYRLKEEIALLEKEKASLK